MKIKKIFLEKAPLYLIGFVFFTAFSLLLVLGIKVSSQSEETVKDISKKEQDNSKKRKDDEIQEFIDILENDTGEITRDAKISAIKNLGSPKKKRSIPILIKYLDYEDEARVNRRNLFPPSVNITEADDLFLDARYPAVGSISHFGKTALPALVEVIEKEESESVRSQNAIYAIKLIFSADWSEGVLYLEKASTESKVPNGGERLQKAAQQIKEIWQRNQELRNN